MFYTNFAHELQANAIKNINDGWLQILKIIILIIIFYPDISPREIFLS